MKFCTLLALASVSAAAAVAVVEPQQLHMESPVQTGQQPAQADPQPAQAAPTQSALETASPASPASPESSGSRLQKREPRRKAIVNKEWLKEKEGDATTHDLPPPWLRTIYGTVPEVVTPTVIGGVTFNTRPTTSSASTEWWVSIKDDGSPKTIKPKIKNGQVKNGPPDPKTYFMTATTIVYKQEELKAHNLKEGDVHEEIKMVPEYDPYVELSPLMRCNPDFYFGKGLAHTEDSAPFCKPHDDAHLRVGMTYFLTWYSRFYADAKNVRFHYSYVKEKLKEAGMHKRDLTNADGTEQLDKRDRDVVPLDDQRAPVKNPEAALADIDSSIHESQGAIAGTFYTSEWIRNGQGWFPVDIEESWLRGKVSQRVLISIQPDTVETETFDILKAPHIVLTFQLKERVGKNTKEMRAAQDAPVDRDQIYYIVMGIPTMVVIAVFAMYVFVAINKKHTDLSRLRKPKRSRFGNKYDTRYAETDLRKPTSLKQS